MSNLYFIPLILIGLIIFLILLDVVFIFVKRYKKRMAVYEKLVSFCSNKLSKITICKDKPMDYILEVKNNIYLVKLLSNFKGYELIVDLDKISFRNKKGVLKKINLNDLKNYNYDIQSKKNIKKIVVIYPDCLNMVNYKTQYDIEYIHDELEINGLYFISASNLLDKEDMF